MKFYTDELLVSCAPADHLICCWNVNHLALVKTMTGKFPRFSVCWQKNKRVKNERDGSLHYHADIFSFKKKNSSRYPNIQKNNTAYIYHIATQDVISLDLFKDEILTINSSNSVSFIPVNDEVKMIIRFLFPNYQNRIMSDCNIVCITSA